MLTVCYTAKGGQGCSTIAALLALLNPPATLIDVAGDLPALLGVDTAGDYGLTDHLTSSDPLGPWDLRSVQVAPGVDLVPQGLQPIEAVPAPRWTELVGQLTAPTTDRWILDAGTLGYLDGADQEILITRHCYLALRRAAALLRRPTSVISVHEAGRSLDRHDIERVIGVPVVATLEVDHTIARAIDAGLVTAGIPNRARPALGQIRL
jgi:hypothetical protein